MLFFYSTSPVFINYSNCNIIFEFSSLPMSLHYKIFVMYCPRQKKVTFFTVADHASLAKPIFVIITTVTEQLQ